jgi:hypothetical protein
MSFWSDCEPRRSDRSQNRGWRSDRQPGRSDRSTLCSSSIACFADLGCLPCGALDFS